MSPVAIVHAAAASTALVLGAWQLLAARRGPRHRIVGYLWVAAMAVTALSSFALRSDIGLDWLAGFSPIHGLSLFTLLSLAMAVRHAIRRNFNTHRRWIRGAYAGLVAAGVFAVAVPGRDLNQLLFAGLPDTIAVGLHAPF